MKKTAKLILLCIAASLMLLASTGCNNTNGSIWDDAVYTTDQTVGDGAKIITIEISAEGKSILLTLKTDKDNLGAALYEHKIINDPEFFNTVLGMTADFNKNKYYWAFYENDTFSMRGVDDVEIHGGEHFKLIYSNGAR